MYGNANKLLCYVITIRSFFIPEDCVKFTPTKRRLTTSHLPILEPVLKPALPSYAIYSPILSPLLPWHFMSLAQSFMSCDTRISSYNYCCYYQHYLSSWSVFFRSCCTKVGRLPFQSINRHWGTRPYSCVELHSWWFSFGWKNFHY